MALNAAEEARAELWRANQVANLEARKARYLALAPAPQYAGAAAEVYADWLPLIQYLQERPNERYPR